MQTVAAAASVQLADRLERWELLPHEDRVRAALDEWQAALAESAPDRPNVSPPTEDPEYPDPNRRTGVTSRSCVAYVSSCMLHGLCWLLHAAYCTRHLCCTLV